MVNSLNVSDMKENQPAMHVDLARGLDLTYLRPDVCVED